MNIIEVKTNADQFKLVWARKKLSELRLDDKDYRVGDLLVQKEWLPKKKRFTGRCVVAQISHITWLASWLDAVDSRWAIIHLHMWTFTRFKKDQGDIIDVDMICSATKLKRRY